MLVDVRTVRRLAIRVGGSVVTLTLLSAPSAQAHGLGGAPGVRVPGFLFAWAAALVLGLSFVALGRLWHGPRLERAVARRVRSMPAAVDVVCGTIGVALFVSVVYAGVAGTIDPNTNLAPSFVFIAFWVAPVLLSILFGDVFAAFSPWRAIARAGGWLARGRLDPPAPYPAWLGRWPAAAGIVAFAWLELVYVRRDDPRILAVLAVIYALVQLLGMARYGEKAWCQHADAFGVYFGLFARLSIFEREGRELRRRPILSGATTLPAAAGTVAMLCVMIGSTGYDGLSGTEQWASWSPHLVRLAARLHLGPSVSLELVGTLGLALMIGLVAGVYRIGIGGIAALDETRTRPVLAQLFAHTLIPIAAGYVLAHYFTFLFFQGQGLIALASDPLGNGANLFATAHVGIDDFIPRAGVWYCQVGALVAGHVAAIVLSHDRALVLYDDPLLVRRSQAWMLTAMVGYTGLGLWILASIR